ncbi:MAG: patatin-like phospholipase family protein [Gemmatimonadetes bacterium]|nr:patatin-like phospholipase family protein [Gemmatimonadota bacterium]
MAFSGGGIRSATFNLGILQGLARLKLLSRFDYLSMVSGGGYIGCWLSAWISRSGLARVEKGLDSERVRRKDRNETHEIKFLRNFSNYLTPRKGIFSADTWTAIATYVRNLTLNLTVLVATLLGALMIPKALIALHGVATEHADLSSLIVSMLLLTLAIATVVTSISSLFSEPNPNLGERGHVWMTYLGAVIPVLVAAWVLSTWLWLDSRIQLTAVWEFSTRKGGRLGEAWNWALGGAAAYLLMWVIGLTIREQERLAPDKGNGDPQANSKGMYHPRFLARRTLYKAANYGRALNRVMGRRAARFRAVTWAAFFSGGVGGIGLFLVRQMMSGIEGSATDSNVAVWGMPLVLVVFVLTGTLQIGFSGTGFSDEAREWWSRLGASLFLGALFVLGATALVGYGPNVLNAVLVKDTQTWWQGSILSAWLATTVAGVLAGKSASKPGRGFRLVAAIAPYVFVVGLLLLLVQLNSVIAPSGTSVGKMAFIAFALILAGLVLSSRVGVNEFSMHAFYRNRLVRAYLGASNERRAAHPFTGFDPTDDLDPMDQIISDRFDGPYPIINAALNLVAGEELAWQQRKAASFTFTPKYIGHDAGLRTEKSQLSKLDQNGYRPTESYGGGIRLGTAMAISGAAASPNMGYQTSTALAFLMTVFNVRLGWWLPNTRLDGWTSRSPLIGIFYLLYELLGMTNQKRRYVYLSDGGHFENLGVYELVKRRCKIIVACDASEDHDMTFASLGNAIEKCRTDLGIDIELDVDPIRWRDDDHYSEEHCAVGQIRYDQVDQGASVGTIIYLKPSINTRVPTDVLRYAARTDQFPHESTADQWFGESQFESYRALGQHIATTTFGVVANPQSTLNVAMVFAEAAR